MPDLSWAEERPLVKAAVVYDSRYGKTRRVAMALAEGIRREGVETVVLTVQAALDAPLADYDLLALGSPNHLLAPSAAMSTFLAKLRKFPLPGRWGFAFDTRTRRHPEGAARQMASTLQRIGFRVPYPSASALVDRGPAPAEPGAKPESRYTLDSEAEAEFRNLGAELVKDIRHERVEKWA